MGLSDFILDKIFGTLSRSHLELVRTPNVHLRDHLRGVVALARNFPSVLVPRDWPPGVRMTGCSNDISMGLSGISLLENKILVVAFLDMGSSSEHLNSESPVLRSPVISGGIALRYEIGKDNQKQTRMYCLELF